MSESKEKHRLRMQLKRSHPEWSGEKLKEELSKISCWNSWNRFLYA